MGKRDERRERWQELVGDWEASGMSGAAFCRERGLVYAQFMYWRKRLEAGDEQERVSGGFVAVAFEEDRAGSCGVRVRVRDELELVLERGFDAGELARAARALLAC
jgi:hypothetical protein